jgi:solute carrier family 25 citrate transporter 1
MLRQGTNQAFNFMAFAWLNKHLWKKRDGEKLAVWKTIINGSLAGSLGPFVTCPLDMVKTRMMAQERKISAPTSSLLQSPMSTSSSTPKPTPTPTSTPTQLQYRGMTHAFQVIIKEEGFAALYKGLAPRIARTAPRQAIAWTVVTRMQSFLEQLYDA